MVGLDLGGGLTDEGGQPTDDVGVLLGGHPGQGDLLGDHVVDQRVAVAVEDQAPGRGDRDRPDLVGGHRLGRGRRLEDLEGPQARARAGRRGTTTTRPVIRRRSPGRAAVVSGASSIASTENRLWRIFGCRGLACGRRSDALGAGEAAASPGRGGGGSGSRVPSIPSTGRAARAPGPAGPCSPEAPEDRVEVGIPSVEAAGSAQATEAHGRAGPAPRWSPRPPARCGADRRGASGAGRARSRATRRAARRPRCRRRPPPAAATTRERSRTRVATPTAKPTRHPTSAESPNGVGRKRSATSPAPKPIDRAAGRAADRCRRGWGGAPSRPGAPHRSGDRG